MITSSAHEFRDVLPDGGRLLGLDVGTKTIGTALCDSRWTIASPTTLINRSKFTKDQEALRAYIASYKADAASAPVDVTMLPDAAITDLFWAAIEATEEAILNALVAAETMTGRDGNTLYALPHDKLIHWLKEYGKI